MPVLSPQASGYIRFQVVLIRKDGSTLIDSEWFETKEAARADAVKILQAANAVTCHILEVYPGGRRTLVATVP